MKIGSKKYLLTVVQYPFLKDILSQKMEPYSGDGGLSTTELIVEAEKAHGDLMYRRADNTGLGDRSFFMRLNGKRKGQVMRCGEYLFAIGRKGKIINRLNWPRNHEEKTEGGETYGWNVLWSGKDKFPSGDPCFTNPIAKKVKYLVWVTVEAWYADTKKEDTLNSRFGEFKGFLIKITIYGEPDQGFEKLEKESNVYQNLSLDSKTLLQGEINKNSKIITIGGMLCEMCITFQDEVYFNGMKKVMNEGKYRGASGQFGAVKVLCAEMCGYDRITLEDSRSYITFKLRPGSKNMYVLAEQGTLPQIRNLVRTVVRMWREDPESREAFKPDKDVFVT